MRGGPPATVTLGRPVAHLSLPLLRPPAPRGVDAMKSEARGWDGVSREGWTRRRVAASGNRLPCRPCRLCNGPSSSPPPKFSDTFFGERRACFPNAFWFEKKKGKKTKKEKSSAEQTFSNGRRGRSPGQEGGGAGRAAAPQWCSASSSGCSSPNRASPSRLSSYRGPSRRDTCKSRKSVRRFSSSSVTCGATEEDKFGKRSLTSRRHLDALRLSLLDSTASRVSPPPPFHPFVFSLHVCVHVIWFANCYSDAVLVSGTARERSFWMSLRSGTWTRRPFGRSSESSPRG